MKDYLQTVTGPVAREDMGLTLPHEHLSTIFPLLWMLLAILFHNGLLIKKSRQKSSGH